MTLYVFDYPDDSHIRTYLLAAKVSWYPKFVFETYESTMNGLFTENLQGHVKSILQM